MKTIYYLASGRTPRKSPVIPDIPTQADKFAAIVAAYDNRRKGDTDMTINPPYIPLTLIADEIGEPVDTLARRLDGAVILDNIGMRVISRDIAADVIETHRRREAGARDRKAAQRVRIAELQARNRASLTGGRPAVSGNSLADLLGVDTR